MFMRVSWDDYKALWARMIWEKQSGNPYRSVGLLFASKAKGSRAGAKDIQGLIGNAIHNALNCILTTLA